ncbi:hypothetical protein [Aureimonas sp. Leaf324]|uniref:hypothetical protein n=1 Tax=Aureimonas sp. Leaf324 TaxID=1736336 RepID=UPI00138F61B8|nr:hypothetical protein [Aureimonas sp. Leaf324]
MSTLDYFKTGDKITLQNCFHPETQILAGRKNMKASSIPFHAGRDMQTFSPSRPRSNGAAPTSAAVRIDIASPMRSAHTEAMSVSPESVTYCATKKWRLAPVYGVTLSTVSFSTKATAYCC